MAGSTTERKDDGTAYMVFIEKDDSDSRMLDPVLMYRGIRALPCKGQYNINGTRCGFASDCGIFINLNGRTDSVLPQVRRILQAHVTTAEEFLAERGGAWKSINRIESHGVAGFGIVGFLHAPPPSSPFWMDLMPDIIKHAEDIQRLCDSRGDAVRIINIGFTPAVLCRNGAVGAVVDSAQSEAILRLFAGKRSIHQVACGDELLDASVYADQLRPTSGKRKEPGSVESSNDDSSESLMKKAKR